MCTYSMIADTYRDIWKDRYPNIWPNPASPGPAPNPFQTFPPPITRQEFDSLKREMEDLKRLLIAAKEYDKRNGEPDCELEEKVEVIRRVARLVGVDIADLALPGS